MIECSKAVEGTGGSISLKKKLQAAADYFLNVCLTIEEVCKLPGTPPAPTSQLVMPGSQSSSRGTPTARMSNESLWRYRRLSYRAYINPRMYQLVRRSTAGGAGLRHQEHGQDGVLSRWGGCRQIIILQRDKLRHCVARRKQGEYYGGESYLRSRCIHPSGGDHEGRNGPGPAIPPHP